MLFVIPRWNRWQQMLAVACSSNSTRIEALVSPDYAAATITRLKRRKRFQYKVRWYVGVLVHECRVRYGCAQETKMRTVVM